MQRRAPLEALLRARGRGLAMRRTLRILSLGQNDGSGVSVRACMLLKNIGCGAIERVQKLQTLDRLLRRLEFERCQSLTVCVGSWTSIVRLGLSRTMAMRRRSDGRIDLADITSGPRTVLTQPRRNADVICHSYARRL
jgi:hypothetical protein